jgi:hypothetical protein
VAVEEHDQDCRDVDRRDGLGAGDHGGQEDAGEEELAGVGEKGNAGSGAARMREEYLPEGLFPALFA